MSTFWPFIALTSLFLAILFEAIAAKKEKALRKGLALMETNQEARFFARIFFLTSLSALALAFCIFSLHQKWTDPKDGVAIVFNAQDPSSDATTLSQEKGALQELMLGLQGSALSLYEYRDGAIFSLVPPTIDRVYFSLMADGMQLQRGEALLLSAIQKQVFNLDQNSRPWIIVISSKNPGPNVIGLDGISSLVPHLPQVSIESFDHGIAHADHSLDALTTRIKSRIFVSQEKETLSVLEKVVLFLTTIGAWLFALQWRKRMTPIFWVCLLCVSPYLEAQNYQVQQAIDVAVGGDLSDASLQLKGLLPGVTDTQARLRLLYDLALISYLQQEPQAAQAWLESESAANVEENLVLLRDSLHVLVLTQLVKKDLTDTEKRTLLIETLKGSKNLPLQVLGQAEMALLLPAVSLSETDEQIKTLLLYTQAINDAFPRQLEVGTAFSSFILTTQDGVEAGLKAVFSSKEAALFKDVLAQADNNPFFLYRYNFWYLLSKRASYNDAVQFLLDEAVESSTARIFFPLCDALFKKNLDDIETLLHSQKITIPTQRSLEAASAHWYVKSKIWKLLKQEKQVMKKDLVTLVHAEMENPLSPFVQEVFAKECIKDLSLPKNWYNGKEPLQALFWEAFLEEYDRDPADALGLLLDWANNNPSLFVPYVTRLLKEKKKFLPLSLSENVEAYNVILLGRLVQIELSPCSLPEEGKLYVTRIIELYRETLSQVQTIENAPIDTLKIIFQEQAKMAGKLKALPVFKDDYTKRTNYENLIEEWSIITLALIDRLQYPYALRLQKFREELDRASSILVKIRQMFEEKEPSSVQQPTLAPSLPQEKHFSIREEEAVRLYQEMERMDRTLYGE